MHIETFLKEIPLFEGLAPENCGPLAGIVVRKKYKRSETVFCEGEAASGFHVILDGRVKVFKLSPDGKEQILQIFAAGEPFGEVPVFTGKHFPANAQALDNTATLYFPRSAFIALIGDNPALALNMMAVLSRRLHKFTDLIENLSLKEVPGRLAAYLLYQCVTDPGSSTVTLDISKAQLASILGTIPETLSRIINRMTQSGLIASKGKRQIRICEPEALEELAQGERRLA